MSGAVLAIVDAGPLYAAVDASDKNHRRATDTILRRDLQLVIPAFVAQYGDFPLGGTDASVIALAERLDTDLIVTFDHRHFRAVRPRHCPSFRLLPGDA